MTGPRDDRGVNVCILDLMCYTPEYDRHLVEAITRVNPGTTTLAAIDFPQDPSVLHGARLHRDPDVVDRVNRWRNVPQIAKPPIKGVEYTVNLRRLARRLPARGVEVVHLQWSPFAEFLPLDIWFIKRLKKSGIKTVHTVHNVVPHDTGKREARRYGRLYSLPDALVCHTENARQQLIDVHGILPERVWVVPHGPMGHEQPRIDRKVARRRLDFHDDEVIVLLFGNVRPYKGIEQCLSAWKTVQRKAPQARLVIAGGGDKRHLDQITRLVSEHGLEKSVRLDLGWIDEDKMIAYHEAADILAYPYRNITQSGALVSGMRYGRAILATDLPGFRDFLTDGETGRLVPVDDDEALAAGLLDLFEDPTARWHHGETVRSRWEERIAAAASWESVAAKTLECYRALLSEPSR